MTLTGKIIVVTRPAHQADKLVQMIQAAGGQVIRFPVIDIVPAEKTADPDAVLSRLHEFDLAIFISANAVNFGLQSVKAAGGLPTGLKIAAVGAATRDALTQAGIQTDIFPQGRYDSEALLALEALQHIDGKHIVIFRGDGGRELLADTLRQRHAMVEYAEVYQRIKPDIDNTDIVKCLKNSQVDAIIVTSDQGLRHLWDMVGDQAQADLLKTQLIVMSERTGRLASEMGFQKQPVVSARAGDKELLDALVRCE